MLADPSLKGWDGFGLAVQAYQKRALAVIDHVAALARTHDRRLAVRLVKGAYWDSEIKRAQERGLSDYPVFTRKAMTDANYLACARLMLASDRLYPQFATHNALTVAAVITEAGARENFEFQRLHGMGEALAAAAFERSRIPWRVYAPVGPHRDLLAYLVRRLIENGANSSFVARAADPLTPESTLIADPYALIGAPEQARNQRIIAPAELYSPLRANSAGVEFGDSAALSALRGEIDAARERHIAAIPSQATTIKAARLRLADRRREDRGRRRGRRRRRRRRDGSGADRLSRLERDKRRDKSQRDRARRRSDRGAARIVDRSSAKRSRQDARRRAGGNPRGGRSLPLLRAAGARDLPRDGFAGTDRRGKFLAADRARRLRLHLAVEFSAGDFHRPDRRRAGRRQ